MCTHDAEKLAISVLEILEDGFMMRRLKDELCSTRKKKNPPRKRRHQLSDCDDGGEKKKRLASDYGRFLQEFEITS